MSVYTTADEERIRAAAEVRAWTQSGLLEAGQGASIESGLRTELRRTNRALRIALFIFGTIVVLALVGLCIVAFDLKLDATVAWTAIVAGVAYFVLAQFLVFKFHLYRFGVEEAFAVWAIVLAGFGAGFLVSSSGTYGDAPALVAFVTAAGASAAVYWRFGYLYAAFAAVACAAGAAFNLDLSLPAERILSACEREKRAIAHIRTLESSEHTHVRLRVRAEYRMPEPLLDELLDHHRVAACVGAVGESDFELCGRRSCASSRRERSARGDQKY